MPPDAASPATEAPRATASPPSRRGDPVTLSWVSVLLLLVALVAVNAAFARARVRVDLTEDRLYSLSDSSRRVVKGLTDPAQIRAYWGQKIPSEQALVRRRIEGLLEEYEAASDGRLSVTWVEMNDEGKKEAQDKGVPEMQFQVIGTSEISASKDYQALWLQYGSQTQVIGPLSEVEGRQFQVASDLEYKITAALWQMSRKTKPVVGFVKSAPPMDFMNPHGGGDRFSFLTGEDVLGGAYKDSLKPWISLDDPVPADVTVLVVAAPRALSDKAVYHLEQFVLRGGKAFVLLDAVDIPVVQGSPPTKSGLEDWLRSYGIDLPDGVLMDYDENAIGAWYTQRAYFPYPYFVRLLSSNMDRDVPALHGMTNVMTFWPTEILVDEAKQRAAGRTTTILATTTASGWRKPDTVGINQLHQDDPTGKTLGKHVVMAMVEGKFTSYWKGKPAPDEPPPPPKPPADAAMGDAAMGDAAMGDAAMGEGAMGDAAMDGAAPPAPPKDAGMEAGAPPPPAAPPAMGTDATPPPPSAAPKEPGKPKDAEKPAPAPGAKGPEGEAGEKGAAKSTRLDEGSGVLVLLGDAGLAADEATGGIFAINGGGTGFALVANTVDWLTGDTDVLALRSRTAKDRKFSEVSEAKATSIKWANYLVAPLAVTIAGLIVFFVRRHRR